MSHDVSHLPYLSAPIRIGSVEVRNRLFVAAHSTNFAERVSSEQLRDYYVERARHGVGLIIHEPVIVHPTSLSRPTKVWGFDPDNVPAYRDAARAVHDEGAAFFCQILHNGAHMGNSFTAGPLWAPSALTDASAGETAHEMTVDEIGEVVEGFARSAEICREGGFDGVELHGSHGYLIQQFLSPLTNRRTDEYGGDEERRRRFLLEIVDAVRRRVGHDFVVGVRIAGDERAPGGITPADACSLAQRLERDGTIDYVNVSTGGSAAPGWIVLDATYERGANLAVAATIKAATTLPVLVAGRVTRPADADAVVAEGAADMVGVARALIADPAWYEKGRRGDDAAIRPCTYCNECVYGIGAFRPIRCSVNPEMGHEREAATSGVRVPAPAKRRVVVAGGGVAGMEAALTAAQRGHDVTLLEAGERLGGQLGLVEGRGIRAELVHLPAHLAGAVVAAGVDVRLGTRADADAVLALAPDAVIVATGAIRPRPDLPGNDQPHVYDGNDMRQLMLGESAGGASSAKFSLTTRALMGAGRALGLTSSPEMARRASEFWMPLGKRVVIIGGDLVGLELAEFIAHRGRTVAVVDDVAKFGKGLAVVRRGSLIDEVETAGVALVPNASEIAIGADAVTCIDAEGQPRSFPADNVILAKGATGDLTLAEQLRAAGFEVHTVGDCNGVGYIAEAMKGAAETASTHFR